MAPRLLRLVADVLAQDPPTPQEQFQRLAYKRALLRSAPHRWYTRKACVEEIARLDAQIEKVLDWHLSKVKQ